MHVELAPWSPGDVDLLRAFNTPEMTAHLGGPETEEKVVARNEKYVRLEAEGTANPFRIVVDGVVAGSVNYWRDEQWYEMGWAVLPAFQGRGVAASAVRLALDSARRAHAFRFVHAFPRVTNLASNAVCRSTGFTLLREFDDEYPVGVFAPSNDWVFDLDAQRAQE